MRYFFPLSRTLVLPAGLLVLLPTLQNHELLQTQAVMHMDLSNIPHKYIQFASRLHVLLRALPPQYHSESCESFAIELERL